MEMVDLSMNAKSRVWVWTSLEYEYKDEESSRAQSLENQYLIWNLPITSTKLGLRVQVQKIVLEYEYILEYYKSGSR